MPNASADFRTATSACCPFSATGCAWADDTGSASVGCGRNAAERETHGMKFIERAVEGILWNSRLITIIAVVASLIVSLVMFYVATADVVYLLREVVHYGSLAAEAREHMHSMIVAHIAEIIDGYLFAAILIIFSLGLYELFISKIDAIELSPVASRVLLIRSLDDLKERLAKVVFLILIVRYFQYALQATIGAPIDLLYLAIGIALVALALYLTNHQAERASDEAAAPELH
jgi:uncharacterized membrane protein YqhA